MNIRALIGNSKYTAAHADKHVLYEESVQNVEFEVDILQRFYRKYNKAKPSTLKEDFCGTFALSCEWVKRNKNHRALGVDLDHKTLAWGKKHNLSQLKAEEQKRIQLIQANVLDLRQPRVDIIAAFNFSYWVFRQRKELYAYFCQAYHSLKQKGMLVLDAFGGPAAETEQEEERKCEGFTYIWEHASFFPLTREMRCKIHFHFKDGTRMRNAFVYDWRLWTPPEISELLYSAGFRQVHWYMEGTDEKSGEGNGVFRPSKRGENAETWIAYALACK